MYGLQTRDPRRSGREATTRELFPLRPLSNVPSDGCVGNAFRLTPLCTGGCNNCSNTAGTTDRRGRGTPRCAASIETVRLGLRPPGHWSAQLLVVPVETDWPSTGGCVRGLLPPSPRSRCRCSSRIVPVPKRRIRDQPRHPCPPSRLRPSWPQRYRACLVQRHRDSWFRSTSIIVISSATGSL